MLLIFRYPHRGLVAPSSHQMQVFVEQWAIGRSSRRMRRGVGGGGGVQGIHRPHCVGQHACTGKGVLGGVRGRGWSWVVVGGRVWSVCGVGRWLWRCLEVFGGGWRCRGLDLWISGSFGWWSFLDLLVFFWFGSLGSMCSLGDAMAFWMLCISVESYHSHHSRHTHPLCFRLLASGFWFLASGLLRIAYCFLLLASCILHRSTRRKGRTKKP